MAFVLTITLLLPFTSQEANAAAFDPEKGHLDLSLRFWNNEKPDTGFYINATSRYLLETVKAPTYGTLAGEWSVMDLARAMYTGYDFINYIPENYFTDYKARVDEEVDKLKGELHTAKSTEYSRITLAMSALGYDIRKMGPQGQYDFVDKLSQSNKYSYKQGINGPIWELLALNTGAYQLVEKPSTYSSESDINTAGKMIDYIMGKEIIQTNGTVGGWALSGQKPDPDIGGMAIQGLALYYTGAVAYPKDAKTSYLEFKKAMERAVVQMAALQNDTGGFNAFSNANAESLTQIIVAITALNLDPMSNAIYLPTIKKTVNFIKNGAVRDGVFTNNMIDNLYTFWAWGSGSSPEVSGFKHVTTGYDGGGGSGNGVNGMATDQALYGLIAYDRFAKGQKPLYDMTDQINGEYKTMKARKLDIKLVSKDKEVTEQYSPYATLKIPAISATNEKVVSWNTLKDGTGVSYFPGELLSIPDKNITLYAQFDSRNYAIDYQLAGGKIIANEYAKNYTNTEAVQLPTATQLVKDGYQFGGWYDNAEFAGTAYTVINKGDSGVKTYFARWIDTNALVKEVISAINGLPTSVVASNKAVIENVSYLYEQLSATQKLEVTNYGKLLDAEQQLKGAIATSSLAMTDAEKSAGVVSYINAIPTTNQITLNNQAVIQEARTAYQILTVKQKSNVLNYRVLLNAEKALAAFESKEIDQKVANELIAKINELPSKVTTKSQEQIEMTRTAYDVIKSSQQDLVTNYNKLVQKEVALQVALNDAAITVDEVKNNASKITGISVPKATITAYVNGKKIGDSLVKDNGKFTIKIPKQKAAVKVVLKTTGTGKATKSTVVQASKTLATPKVNSVKAADLKVTGTATKNTVVTVYTANEKKIGTATVTSKGNYSVKIAKQKKNTILYVEIKDSMNNSSKKKSVKVK